MLQPVYLFFLFFFAISYFSTSLARSWCTTTSKRRRVVSSANRSTATVLIWHYASLRQDKFRERKLFQHVNDIRTLTIAYSPSLTWIRIVVNATLPLAAGIHVISNSVSVCHWRAFASIENQFLFTIHLISRRFKRCSCLPLMRTHVIWQISFLPSGHVIIFNSSGHIPRLKANSQEMRIEIILRYNFAARSMTCSA